MFCAAHRHNPLHSFVSYVAALQTPHLPPSIAVTWGQRLSSTSPLTGFTSVKTGTYQLGPWGDPKNLPPMAMMRREPAVFSVGLTSQQAEGRGWTTQASLSDVDQSLTFDYALKVLGGVKLRLGLNLGTGSGITLNANGDRRLTETVRVGLGVSGGWPSGVTMRFRLNRLGQKVQVPVVLSREFRADLFAICAIVPAASMSALHYYYLQPRKRRRIETRLQDLRRENREMIRERRQAAASALDLLRDQARKRWQAESRRGGLVIVEAWYGKESAMPLPRPTRDPEQLERDVWDSASAAEAANLDMVEESADDVEAAYWDVRIALQAMVNKGQLVIPGGRTKASILGFHDPCMGEKKRLKVRYIFHSQLHEAVIDDFSQFAAPLRAHQV